MHTRLSYALLSPAARPPCDLRRTVSSPFQNSGPVHNDPSSFEEMESFLMSV